MNDTPILTNYINLIEPENKFYINVGSSDEFNLDRSLIRNSDITLFFEYDKNKLWNYNDLGKNFHIFNERVTPFNLKNFVEYKTQLKNPKLLDIDIDGYDFFVVKEFLNHFRPTIILAEINEKIPPPIKFAVKYSDNYAWDVSHFYGASIEKYAELFDTNGYEMINLSYNNVYAVAKEKNPNLQTYKPKELFDKFYKNTDRNNYFGHNRNVDFWLNLSEKEARNCILSFFKERDNEFELS